MRKLLKTLLILALANQVCAQESNIYWTGLLDRWGGGDQNGFSLTPGGSDFQKVSGGEIYHFIYDESVMTGEGMSCNMNRAGVTMLSLTFNGLNPGSGFILDTVGSNSDGIKLAGNVLVNGGGHLVNNSGIYNDAPNFIVMTSSTEWNVAADAQLVWNIDLEGQDGIEGITKTGDGTLIIGGGADLRYTGNTIVEAGVFGGHASLAGGLSFASGSKLAFSIPHTLTVAGETSFAGPFGVADIVGIDSTVPAGSYTLIDGAVNFANITNVGVANALGIGEDGIAYFQEETSSLILVVEGSTGPTTWADWPIVNAEGDVDTGEFIGWINVTHGDWIWNYNLQVYMYLPEILVTENGSWSYIPR